MKFSIVQYKAVACWQWNTSDEPHKLYRYGKQGAANQTGLPYDEADDDDDDDDDVCGICQLAFEACCPECAIPGDDCPLIWGKCSHTFHMHCLLKWIGLESSKNQCPLDRRPWEMQDRNAEAKPATSNVPPADSLPNEEELDSHQLVDAEDDDEDEEMDDTETTNTDELVEGQSEWMEGVSMTMDPIRI